MQATVTAPPTNPFFQARCGRDRAARRLRGGQRDHRGLRTVPRDHRRAALGLAGRRGHRRRPSHPGDPAPGQRRGPRRLAGRSRSRRSRTARRRRPASHVGEDAAAAMLLLRADDGWDAVVPYTPGTDPGDWQPTPPAFAPAFLPGWGQVTPFGLEAGSQFRPPPPPALRTRQVCERLQRGQAPRPDRQPVPPARSHRCRAVLRRRLPGAGVELGRAPGQRRAGQDALGERAGSSPCWRWPWRDASIAVFDTKYHYNFWRPVTAIRAGDLDGNHEDRPGSGLAPADRHAGVPELRVGPRDPVRRRPRGARARLRQATATPSP